MAEILIVDDEEGIRRTMALFLKDAGHTVRSACCVDEARRVLDEVDVDVILSDIVMPGDDGLRLLDHARTHRPLASFILITGEPTLETATEALRMGAFDYLPKPVRKDTVCQVVAKAAAMKELRAANARLDAENRRHREELERQVAERTVELEKAIVERETALVRVNQVLESTTLALSMALDMRDPYTGGHQRRVTLLACAIWDRMGLPQEARDGLRMAGLLHDLGKIKVPADILTKPTRLSTAEFDLIKEHPVSAWEVLRLLDFPWPVATIVRQHHERLDGSGYPDHLKDGEILQEARILGVADVVEAMASHRPYRPALGIETALAEITRGRGTIYCERTADACLAVFREDGFVLPT